MNPRLTLLGCCITGLLFLLGCDRLPGKPTAADVELEPRQVRDFDVLFGQNCSGCHGKDGNGNGALALNNPTYLAIVSDDVLRRATSYGVAGTLMPAFLKSAGGTLTDEQVEILVLEIRARWGKPDELGKATPPSYVATTPGDLNHGAEVYAIFCASCHGSDGRGTPKASAIVDDSYLALVSDQGLRTLVIAGRPDLPHPDWRGYVPGRTMAAQEVTDVVAWLVSKRVAYPGQPYASKE
jgi:cytochrome c oxidase cbb3-type subunit III